VLPSLFQSPQSFTLLLNFHFLVNLFGAGLRPGSHYIVQAGQLIYSLKLSLWFSTFFSSKNKFFQFFLVGGPVLGVELKAHAWYQLLYHLSHAPAPLFNFDNFTQLTDLSELHTQRAIFYCHLIPQMLFSTSNEA
jgi:hypothetical protein